MEGTAKKTPSPKKPVATKELSAQVFDTTGKAISTTVLPDAVFKIVASARLLAQYVRVYLSNQRQGTHKAKDRSEVSASTKKIYKQKGTGRARHGARTAALFVGGGVTHGPVVRTHALRMNKKQRQKALLCSLSLKAEGNNVIILDNMNALNGKTKEMASLIKTLDINPKKTLIVYAPDQAELFRKLLSNIKNTHTSQDRLMNAFAVLKAEKVIFTTEALADFLSFRKVAN